MRELVDFRFDLGTILGREPHGFDQRGGFFDAIGQDPVLRKVKLVGELLVRCALGAGKKINSLEYFDNVTTVHRERIRHSSPPHNEDSES